MLCGRDVLAYMLHSLRGRHHEAHDQVYVYTSQGGMETI